MKQCVQESVMVRIVNNRLGSIRDLRRTVVCTTHIFERDGSERR